MISRRAAWFLGLLMCCRASFIIAHDFWLQPTEYWMSPDALISITLEVGHGPFRQRSPIPARRITRFDAIGPKGKVVDLHERLRLGGATEDGDFRLGIWEPMFWSCKRTTARRRIYRPFDSTIT